MWLSDLCDDMNRVNIVPRLWDIWHDEWGPIFLRNSSTAAAAARDKPPNDGQITPPATPRSDYVLDIDVSTSPSGSGTGDGRKMLRPLCVPPLWTSESPQRHAPRLALPAPAPSAAAHRRGGYNAGIDEQDQARDDASRRSSRHSARQLRAYRCFEWTEIPSNASYDRERYTDPADKRNNTAAAAKKKAHNKATTNSGGGGVGANGGSSNGLRERGMTYAKHFARVKRIKRAFTDRFDAQVVVPVLDSYGASAGAGGSGHGMEMPRELHISSANMKDRSQQQRRKSSTESGGGGGGGGGGGSSAQNRKSDYENRFELRRTTGVNDMSVVGASISDPKKF